METGQVILLVGFILITAVAVASLLWVVRLERKLAGRPSYKMFELDLDANQVLTDKAIAKIAKQVEDEFERATQESIKKLHQSLNQVLKEATDRVGVQTQAVTDKEFSDYRQSITDLTTVNAEELSAIRAQYEAWHQQMGQELQQSVAEEQQRRLNDFDSRINDVVSNYLLEALGNQVDLGAQGPYIMRTLEAHKDDIKKDIAA
jgi:DNA anti-recombination protein RmuC